MAHGLDGCDGFSLILSFGFNGTRIGRIFSDFNFIKKKSEKICFIRLICVPLKSEKIRENPFYPSNPCAMSNHHKL